MAVKHPHVSAVLIGLHMAYGLHEAQHRHVEINQSNHRVSVETKSRLVRVRDEQQHVTFIVYGW